MPVIAHNSLHAAAHPIEGGIPDGHVETTSANASIGAGLLRADGDGRARTGGGAQQVDSAFR